MKLRGNNQFLVLSIFTSFILLFSVIGPNSNNLVFAQNTEFTVLKDDLLKSPIALSMLEKIEQSKKILADLQAGKKPLNEHQKFIEEQRKIVNERLQADLARMNHDYQEYTPRAAFSKFLSGVNGTYHEIYWGQFNHLENKIQLARNAMNVVLQNGGSYHEAQQEYFKYASMSRAEMIQVNQDLNIKFGFADPDVQKAFNKFGKLPRTEK